MALNMRLEMKNRSHKYDINRPRHRNRHTYTKHKMYLNMMKLATPFANLFVKVTDFQFKYVKKTLEQEKVRRDIFMAVTLHFRSDSFVV